MLIDVLPQPDVERVWNWDGTPEDAAAIGEHVSAFGLSNGVTTTFVDHGDGTATVANTTYMYGSPSYPVEAHRWYRMAGGWSGAEPVPTDEAEINALYRPKPEYPLVFAGVEPELPSGEPIVEPPT